MTFDRIATIALCAAALSMAGAVVWKELITTDTPATQPVAIRESGWASLLANGRTVGELQAPIQLVEVTDLQCPACRHFQSSVVDSLLERYRGKIALTIVHYPLSSHRLARAAARASECAAEMGAFCPFVRAAFALQDSVAALGWTRIARAGNIADSARFSACVSDSLNTSRFALVDSGFSASTKMRAVGTPTVLINGWKYSTPPQFSQLARVADAILRGEKITLKTLE